MQIPIIGNGDVTSAEICKQRFEDYGVDAVMIGRASIGRPWIFREVKHYLTTGELLPQEPFSWYLDILKKQVEQSVERLDERRGILHIRRHLAATPLFKGITDFKQTRIAMLRAETVNELFEIMNNIPKSTEFQNNKLDIYQIETYLRYLYNKMLQILLTHIINQFESSFFHSILDSRLTSLKP